MNRFSFILHRLGQMVIVLFGITVMVFFMVHLTPGDPARIYLGTRATDSAVANLHHQWGLDRPLPAQYELFMGRLVRGDLGTSLLYQSSDARLILDRLPSTLWLLGYSVVLSLLIAVPLAATSATKKDGLRDHAIRLGSVISLGMPSFWVGIMLILLLGVDIHAFPVGGYGNGVIGHLWSMFLPGLTIAIAVSPLLLRSLRASMLNVLDADFVATARSKGIPRRRILVSHVLRNAIIPMITVLGLNVSFLIGGTVVVEKVFALPGLGNLMLQAILARDFPVVQAVTLVFAVMVVLVNLMTDVVYSLLDPRVSFD
ncbi:MAG: peptide/nickel transport system permease protein [Nocardioidaceae bacterium]|nr:peptide/nickel transport system permease protein [Nocardioidaceae bacterium]